MGSSPVLGRVLEREGEKRGKKEEPREEKNYKKRSLQMQCVCRNAWVFYHFQGATENAVGMDVVMSRRGCGKRETGHLLVVEEDADGFTVVDATNGLGEDGGDI